MKSINNLTILSLFLCGLVSCNKDFTGGQMQANVDNDDTTPCLIKFSAEGEGIITDVTTKAAAVTTLTSFNVSATTGTAGSETPKWTSVSFTGAPNYTSDKVWPATNPSYHFYASNLPITFAAAGSTISPDGTIDAVVSYLPSPVYKNSNNLAFKHIYARIGSVSASAATGSLSGVSVRLTNVATGGTYNIRTDKWTAGSTSNKSLTIGGTGSAGENDLYIVPGTYTVSITYTHTNGDYTEEMTKTGSATFSAGKINNLNITIPVSTTDIQFTVTISPWTTTTVNVTVS